MWNPFTRRGESASDADSVEPIGRIGPSRDDDADAESCPTPAPGTIAEVQLMGQTAVATLSASELTQDEGADQLASLLDELGRTGALHFVLDVQNVQYMDTACLGCLVEALNKLADHGGRIALANPNHSVHYVFRLTRLDRVFRICSNVMAAIEAVEEHREAG